MLISTTNKHLFLTWKPPQGGLYSLSAKNIVPKSPRQTKQNKKAGKTTTNKPLDPPCWFWYPGPKPHFSTWNFSWAERSSRQKDVKDGGPLLATGLPSPSMGPRRTLDFKDRVQKRKNKVSSSVCVSLKQPCHPIWPPWCWKSAHCCCFWNLQKANRTHKAKSKRGSCFVKMGSLDD